MAVYLLDGILLVLLFICCYTDLTKKKIYNKVILAGIISGFIINCLFIRGAAGILFCLQGFFFGSLLLFLPFAAGGMGAGDVKLLGMIGLFKGAGFVFPVFLLAALLGGLISIVSLARQGKLLPLLAEIFLFFKLFFFSGFQIIMLPSFTRKRVDVPQEAEDRGWFSYGPALVLASLLVYFFPFFRVLFAFPLR